MQLLLLVTLSGMLSAAKGYTLSTLTPNSPPLVVVHTYTRSQNCKLNDTIYYQLPIYEDGKCTTFPEGAETLRVVDSDKRKLRYNSRKWFDPRELHDVVEMRRERTGLFEGFGDGG